LKVKAKPPLFLFFLLIAVQSSGQTGLRTDTSYYESGEIREIRTFKKRSMINHLVFDQTGTLIYQSPLLPAQKIPTYRFVSGRTYYDQQLKDTVVFDNNIPHLNLFVSFSSATILRINGYTYFIKALKPQPQKGKMVIKVIENAFVKTKVVLDKVVYWDIR